MNFLNVLRVTSNLLKWSPDSKICAVAITARLEIRDGNNLELLNTFNCQEQIQAIEWAHGSSLIYTANLKKGIIEIWDCFNPEWRCKIDEGTAGLSHLLWSPDGRHILTVAEFHLRITVWSLTNKTIFYIKHPKNILNGQQFSNDGEYLAIVQRINCKDVISLLETKSWTVVKEFDVQTKDAAGLRWCPDDSVLAVWDSPLEYKLTIYTISGQCLASFSAYEWALGIKCVTWSPSSQFIAIGSYDGKVRLMNSITWKIFSELEHSTTIDDMDCSILNEMPLETKPENAPYSSSSETHYVEAESRPVNLPFNSSDKKSSLKSSSCVSNMIFSSDGRFLATKTENMPNAVWIWNVSKLSLQAVLLHLKSVKDFCWRNHQNSLSICTGDVKIYLWSLFGCLAVPLPIAQPFPVVTLKWNPSGSKLALVGKDSFSICLLNTNKGKTIIRSKREDTQENEISQLAQCQ